MNLYPTVDEVIATSCPVDSKIWRFPGYSGSGSTGISLGETAKWLLRRHHPESAALWESLSQNHPFVNGNKRVAATVTAAFLKVNGCRLEFDDVEAFSFLVGLYETRALKFNQLENWLRKHIVRSD